MLSRARPQAWRRASLMRRTSYRKSSPERLSGALLDQPGTQATRTRAVRHAPIAVAKRLAAKSLLQRPGGVPARNSAGSRIGSTARTVIEEMRRTTSSVPRPLAVNRVGQVLKGGCRSPERRLHNDDYRGLRPRTIHPRRRIFFRQSAIVRAPG